jgi:spermidine synthase
MRDWLLQIVTQILKDDPSWSPNNPCRAGARSQTLSRTSAPPFEPPAMPDSSESAQHVKPFIYESLSSKALHFSICEIQSRMELVDPYALALEYTRTMMGFLLFNPQPDNIAMIGLGGGSLAKFCYRYLPKSIIRVVEINPHVIALRDAFHVPPDNERFRVIQGDGAHFVRHPPSRVDVLLVDGFNSQGLPARLASQRFYDDCREALQPGGVMVANLHCGHLHFEVFLDRIRRSFGASVLVVDDGELSNSIVFACKGDALDKQRAGAVRPPKSMEASGADQLLAAFALISSALRDRQRRRR